MNESIVGGLIFYLLAAIALVGAAWVAFSRSIVHSAFALLATFFGVAGLYAFLSADLLAVVQLLVYVGGVLVLILFAVMLTSRIADVRVSNPALGRVPGLAVLLVVAGLIAYVAIRLFGSHGSATPAQPTTAEVGNALLSTYVLPFEVISILLLAVLLGAVTLARGERRDERDEERN
jgi:NAD(P)H-quinone oxidoreductase subunit 6